MQSSPPKPRPFHIFGTRNRQTSFVATDFLRGNDRMASLLPAANRMARLQADCAAALPALFGACDVISFQESVLVLAVPSSALAARLKQMLPKLQTALQGRGWGVESIRLKVQMARAADEKPQMRTLELPPTAVQAFEELAESLPETTQNKELVAALRALAAKRKA
ncbi:DciA family protein [Massilia sp. ST3]|uniref:DciA family protein n=1 Tax=Massilia sp. ST3 TaxID=2824903 RepID=UPI001E2BD802|nr:DciA family protein [Massilia sp. ST3]